MVGHTLYQNLFTVGDPILARSELPLGYVSFTKKADSLGNKNLIFCPVCLDSVQNRLGKVSPTGLIGRLIICRMVFAVVSRSIHRKIPGLARRGRRTSPDRKYVPGSRAHNFRVSLVSSGRRSDGPPCRLCRTSGDREDRAH